MSHNFQDYMTKCGECRSADTTVKHDRSMDQVTIRCKDCGALTVAYGLPKMAIIEKLKQQEKLTHGSCN
jgi:ribosomal protein S27E